MLDYSYKNTFITEKKEYYTTMENSMKDAAKTGEATTKELLLLKGIPLFAEKGYSGTTTRMIADVCDVNVSTIAFHFGNKEGYYNSVVQFAANKIETDFQPIRLKVEAYLQSPSDDEVTFQLIEEYIDELLEIVKNKDNHQFLYLLIAEQTHPPNGEFPLTAVVYKQSEHLLARLMMVLHPTMKHDTAAIHARIIIGSLISLGEHPVFLQRALNLESYDDLNDAVWEEVRQFILKMIRIC